MTKSKKKERISNQVFIGCPWNTVRPKYVRSIEKLKKKYPLSFVIIGREANQDAHDLLTLIKDRLLSSSYAVFDATGANANVSLEYGIADAGNVRSALYLSARKSSGGKPQLDSPIIADLAGKMRQHYKQEPQLMRLLGSLCRDHDYTKEFEKFVRDQFKGKPKGQKKRWRALALKLIHSLDSQQHRKRADIAQEVLGGSVRYREDEVDSMIKWLHSASLIKASPGRRSVVSIRRIRA